MPNKIIQQGRREPDKDCSRFPHRMLKRATFSPSQPWRAKTRLVPGKAAGDARTGGVPLGYVEDSCETRTQLMACFSIRLEEPLGTEEERPRHPRMRHPQTDTPLSSVDEILLIQ